MNIPNDEHILNFRAGSIQCLPEWFQPILDRYVSVIVGPGDVVHPRANRMLTNIEQFKEYDVFCCVGYDDTVSRVPGESYTSVADNLMYLRENHYHQKLLCIIDVLDDSQMENFTRLFSEKCIIMGHQDNHTPNFPPKYSSACLIPGGILYQRAGLYDYNVITKSGKTTYNAYNDAAKMRSFGLKCAIDTIVDPAERRLKNVMVCTKIDYGLWGGRRKLRTVKQRGRVRRIAKTKRRRT
jgi:hypothetical protein